MYKRQVKQYRRDTKGLPLLVPTNPEYPIIDAKKWNIKGVCIAVVKRGGGKETLDLYKHGMRPEIQRPIP